MPDFRSRITGKLNAASSSALAFRIDTDTQYRVEIEAGGRILWGPGGSTNTDTNLYRSVAGVLKTDTVFQAVGGVVTLAAGGTPSASLSDGGLAVDTTNHKLYYRSGSTWRDATPVSTLASGYLFIGNNLNVPTARQISGDITISNLGLAQLQPQVVGTNQIAPGTDNQVLMTNTTGTDAEWRTITGDVTFDVPGSTTIGLGKVTTNKLNTATGQIAGAWNAYTPTVTGVTGGSPTVTGDYLQVGKTVYFSITYTLGATPTAVSLISFTLPVTAVNGTAPGVVWATMTDSSAAAAYPTVLAWTTTTVAIRALNAASTYGVGLNPTLAIPFTWTTSDSIRIGGVYEAA